MDSNTILHWYLAAFGVSLLVEIALEFLNQSFVRARANEIPELFRLHTTKEEYKRSIDYTITKSRFSIVSSLYSAVWLLAWILNGWFGNLETFARSLVANSYGGSILFLLLLSLSFSIISIPLSLYSTFVIEERFGFNKTSFKTWILDLIKSFIISGFLMTIVLFGIFWFMSTTGERWWIYATVLAGGFQFLLFFLYPVLIAPLFNKFTGLEPGSLSEKISTLCKKLDFSFAGIFVMDGSRRTSHGNAYFTGFGRNRRIVFFDTLISDLSEPQTLSVLAHEIGHEKLNHIKKSFVLTFLLMGASFYVINLFLPVDAFYRAFGFPGPSDAAALAIFTFISAPIFFFISPLFSILSRKYEYEADRFAIRGVGGWRDLAEGLLLLSRKNLSNLTPHPLYSFFHYSHPTLAERIGAMERAS